MTEDLNTVPLAEEVQQEPSTEEKRIQLTDDEFAAIEAKRREEELINEFKARYEQLVRETGFAWAVDMNSSMNNPQLGIARIQQR